MRSQYVHSAQYSQSTHLHCSSIPRHISRRTCSVAAALDALPRAPSVSLPLDGIRTRSASGSTRGSGSTRQSHSTIAELEGGGPLWNAMERSSRTAADSLCTGGLVRTQSCVSGASKPSRLERHKVNHQRKLDRDCSELQLKIERAASRGQSINRARSRKRESMMSRVDSTRGVSGSTPDR